MLWVKLIIHTVEFVSKFWVFIITKTVTVVVWTEDMWEDWVEDDE
jgi:hypothetical protein